LDCSTDIENAGDGGLSDDERVLLGVEPTDKGNREEVEWAFIRSKRGKRVAQILWKGNITRLNQQNASKVVGQTLTPWTGDAPQQP